MSGGAAGVKAAVGTFIVFGFLTWISACIGIAGLQRSCWDLESLRAAVGRGDNWFEGLPLTGIRGFSRSLGCNAVYGCGAAHALTTPECMHADVRPCWAHVCAACVARHGGARQRRGVRLLAECMQQRALAECMHACVRM